VKKLVVGLLLLAFGQAQAAPATPQQIAFAEEYLNSLKTIVSDFIQQAPSGDVSTGTFYLSRPGKLRWQYNPPVPILIVVNKGTVAYYDAELDEITYLSDKETLTSFLTRPEIKFSDVQIVNAESENKALRITFALKDKPDDGSMTLVFEEAPFLLRKIELTDAANNHTSINLNNPKFGVAIDDKLFTFKNPRYNKKR
jgi:outer membrane lipoprotein-sorting protein